MYSLLYHIYFISYKKWIEKNCKLSGVIFRAVVWISQRYFTRGYVKRLKRYPVYGLNRKVTRDIPIVASLTTFPERIDTVWITIETIFRQKVKPDVVELWLADTQFPNGLKDLPAELLNQMERGLNIRFCDDLRSHKKYYYAMQEHPDAIVITFDDDFFYPLDTIGTLLAIYKDTLKNVVGMSNTCFSKDDFMNPIKWGMQQTEIRNGVNIGICGGTGTLFPPNSLDKEAFDKKKIIELSFKADDQWLTAMIYKNHRYISTVGRVPFPIGIPGTQEYALTKTNNLIEATENNNTQWEKVIEFYKEDLAEWISKIE